MTKSSTTLATTMEHKSDSNKSLLVSAPPPVPPSSPADSPQQHLSKQSQSTSSVGELRKWLSDFGEQNRQHYESNHVLFQERKTYNSKSNSIASTSVRGRIKDLEKRTSNASASLGEDTATTLTTATSTSASSNRANNNELMTVPTKDSEVTTVSTQLGKDDEKAAAPTSTSPAKRGLKDKDDTAAAAASVVVVPGSSTSMSSTRNDGNDDGIGDGFEIVEPSSYPHFYYQYDREADEAAGSKTSIIAVHEDQVDDEDTKEEDTSDTPDLSKTVPVAIEVVPIDHSPHPPTGASWRPSTVVMQPKVIYGDSMTAHDTTMDMVDGSETPESGATGIHTDPVVGSFTRKLVRRLHRGRTKDDSEDSDKATKSPGKARRRKLPMLLGKSGKNEKGTETEDEAKNNLTLGDFASASNGDCLPDNLPTRDDKIVDDTFERQPDPSPSRRMHNAEVFNKYNTMTSTALEFHCNGREPPQIAQYPTDEVASSSGYSEDSGMPSIRPGAVDTRLNEIFAEETELLNKEAAAEVQVVYPINDNSSSKNSSLDSTGSATVSSVVQRFGGVAKKSGIQRRKEQLEKKWAEDRVPMHVKKVKWQPGKSSGTYKKKVVLDYYYPESQE